MKKYISFVFITAALFAASCSNSQQQSNVSNVTVLTASDFQKQLTAISDRQLIDVRTPSEYAEGHLQGANNININNPDFIAQISKLDKSKSVFVYCRSGGRSAMAAQKLQEMGFEKVYDLQGGITAWKNSQFPITQEETASVQPDTFTRADYDKLLAENKLLLVDFYAPWCAPCLQMKPTLEKLTKEYAGKVFIYRLNVDEAKVLCKELHIDAIPVTAVFKNGAEQKRVSGLQTEDDLRQLLKL
jgi:thioredoxin